MNQPGEGDTVSADEDRLHQVVNVVAAFISNNRLSHSELLDLIASVNGAFVKLAAPAEETSAAPKDPAVPIKKSVTFDHIICLEDGKKFKSLRRHLKSTYNMTPEQYRMKWKLPSDYPMVAPSYSQARSALAKASGLGRAAAIAKRKAASAPPAKPQKGKTASTKAAPARKKKA